MNQPIATAEISSDQVLEPRIVPRPEHNISRNNIPQEALKVLYRLHRHGYKAYLVGGSVRDLLLGKKPKDFDVGTDAHPGQVRSLFKNSRIIGRRFKLVQVFFGGGKIIEVSTFRKASDPDEDGMLLANNTFGNPAEDALRRDLTINALFYNIADFSVVDYVGGLADLKAGMVRGVGDPELRFHRDPVRVLRAVRHAARAGLTLTPDTWQAVEHHKDELCLCPESRIRDEIMRDLKGGAAGDWLELAHATGVLYSLLPPLKPIYGSPDSPWRARAAELMRGVDPLVAQGKAPDDPVVVSLFLWPALEALAQDEEFPPGRAGRAAWSLFVRDKLPELAQPVTFAKRVMERMCQIVGLMGFVRGDTNGARLPKKISDKGYFEHACQLASLLGHDLRALSQDPAQRHGGKKRRRRRRKRKPSQARKAARQSAPQAE